MKKRGRRLLRYLPGLFVGAMALSLVTKAPVMASGTNCLASLHAGAAEVLDSIDYVEATKSQTMTSSGNDSREEEKTESSESAEEAQESKSDLVMADVQNSMNVRTAPSEDSEIVGLLYADCGGKILEQGDGWTKIQSGDLVGWANNNYLIFDKEAETLAADVGQTIAVINADALRVRKEPNESAGVYGLVKIGDTYNVITENTTSEWLAIDFEGNIGYLSSQYANVDFSIDSGETLVAIAEREKKEKEEKAKLIANLGAVAVGTTDDVLLGALIQCEAGGESYEGQLAVGAVVMNRVRSGVYPTSISGVIYASGQFTPAINGKVETQLAKGVKDSCLQAAREAINGATNIGTAMHFRRVGSKEGYVIGNHVFW